MREKAQLDLRIVSRDEQHAFACNKRATNRSTHFGANRNVLQVWIRRTQSACRRAGLTKRAVNAACCRANRFIERFELGADEFRKLAILKNLLGKR